MAVFNTKESCCSCGARGPKVGTIQTIRLRAIASNLAIIRKQIQDYQDSERTNALDEIVSNIKCCEIALEAGP